MLHRKIGIGCSLLLLVFIDAAHCDDGFRKLRLGVKLTDGSYVIGNLDVSSLPVGTGESTTDVQLSNVRAIRFTEGVKSVVIWLRNGQKLEGNLLLARLDLSTIFGNVTIENEKVATARIVGWLGDPVDTDLLYALTRNVDGKIGIHHVNTMTGVATTVMELTEAPLDCYHLSFHVPTGRFLTLSYSTPTLGIFDPTLEKFMKVPITGLPVGHEKLSGITYREDTDQILVTFGSSRDNVEDRLAEISIDGRVRNVSPNLGLGDRDTVCWNPLSGELITADYNGTAPRIAVVSDPFQRLSTTAWANPPPAEDIIDLAILPSTGQMFTIRTSTNELVELDQNGNRYSTIGPIRTSANVVGIAVAPNSLGKQRIE